MFKIFVLLAPYAFEWPSIGKITAHSAYDMFSWYKLRYIIVNLVFSHLRFWSGNLFLIAPFPDRCIFVHFYNSVTKLVIHRDIGFP